MDCHGLVSYACRISSDLCATGVTEYENLRSQILSATWSVDGSTASKDLAVKIHMYLVQKEEKALGILFAIQVVLGA